MAIVLIRSTRELIIEIAGGIIKAAAGGTALLSCRDNGVSIFKAYYIRLSETGENEPAQYAGNVESLTFAIDFVNGKAVGSAGCMLIDWRCCYEAVIHIDEALRDRPDPAPSLLSEILYNYKYKPAMLRLYKENGIRLYVDILQTGEELCYYVGEAEDGRIELIDAVKEKLAVIHIKNKRKTEHERMIVVDGSLNTLLDISGNVCRISNGNAELIESIPSLSGFERLIVFEYADGLFIKRTEEIGHYTRAAYEPKSNEERAICFIQEACIGKLDHARGYLVKDLSMKLGDEEIHEFIGACEDVLTMPRLLSDVYDTQDSVIIGLTAMGEEGSRAGSSSGSFNAVPVLSPRLMKLSFEDSKIADIELIDDQA